MVEEVITILCDAQPLPELYRDHSLTNSRSHKGMPYSIGLVLVYTIIQKTRILKLILAGTHSDLF